MELSEVSVPNDAGIVRNGPEASGPESPENRNPKLTYGIDDVPPWYLCLFMALQHYLTMIGAIVSIPFILTPALCMAEDDPSRSYIISTMILVTGIVTLIQTTVGCRLPLVQGGTISFLVPTLAILNLPQWKCPPREILDAMSHDDRTELWQIRMRELSGAIAVSALFQIIVGFGGIVGWLLKFITPLTIVPTVSLVGLSLFENAADAASQHWGIAVGTILMLTTYSQILVNVEVPIVIYRKGEGLRIVWFALFKLFPVLLTIVVMWVICTILTVTDAFPPGHPDRADTKLKIITDSPWFRVPYPGQWGVPTVSLSGVLGMLAGVLACIQRRRVCARHKKRLESMHGNNNLAMRHIKIIEINKFDDLDHRLANDCNYLETLIFAQKNCMEEKWMITRTRNATRTCEIQHWKEEEIDVMCKLLGGQMEILWQEMNNVLSSYESSTRKKRKQYEYLKEQDDAMRLGASVFPRLQTNFQSNIEILRGKEQKLTNERYERIEELTRQAKLSNEKIWKSRHEMRINQTIDAVQVKRMSVISASVIKNLTKIEEKGSCLLMLMKMCSNLEPPALAVKKYAIHAAETNEETNTTCVISPYDKMEKFWDQYNHVKADNIHKKR